MGKFDDLKRKKGNVDSFIAGADEYQNKSQKEKDIKKEALERLNVEVPKSLHKAIKLKAIEEEVKIRDLVIKAINEYLKK